MDDARLREAAHRNRLQVAIDGPAGAGKSTVGQGVARRLQAQYLDTGLMYRAVTWLAIQSGVAPNDELGLAELARTTRFESAAADSSLLVNGRQLDRDLRSAAVDSLVSEVSAHPQVRRILVEEQQRFADDRCVVVVGRDIGTVVLPNAPVKLWVTASAEERARRRLREGLAGSGDIDVSEMAGRIRARDELDASRPVSPLVRADDAFVLDTDALSEEEAVATAIEVIRDALNRKDGVQGETAGIRTEDATGW